MEDIRGGGLKRWNKLGRAIMANEGWDKLKEQDRAFIEYWAGTQVQPSLRNLGRLKLIARRFNMDEVPRS